tara:strand:- start:20576 stop:20812 length:237 start_codon:yes stop_codon:yes gene_type:complete
MDFKKHFNNIDNLNKQLDELLILQNQAFSKLDKESYAEVKKYHEDINDMMRKFKAGDFKAIDNYLQKYTDINAHNSRK